MQLPLVFTTEGWVEVGICKTLKAARMRLSRKQLPPADLQIGQTDYWYMKTRERVLNGEWDAKKKCWRAEESEAA